MPLLIITPPLIAVDNTALFDYVQSPDGNTVASHGSVPLGLLPALAERQTEVVLVLPAQALSWHQVLLPQGSFPKSLFGDRRAIRLQAILQSLLEDQLLDDPTHLHLALQPQPPTNAPVWVAACDHAWLKAALTALSVAGYEVSRIVPEVTPQGLRDVHYVTGEADNARLLGLLRPSPTADAAASAGVLVCDLSAASVLLLGDGGRDILAEPAVAALAEQLFKKPVMLQQWAERQLQAALSPWDMAQFDLAHAGRDRRRAQMMRGFSTFARAPQWRAARLALVAVVLGNLLGLNAWALREQANLTAQRQRLQAVLIDTFPNTPVVVDAPTQMARAVAALQRASGAPAGSDLESMLASFSALAPVGYAPTAIDYVVGELRLTGPALTAAEQVQLIAGLKARGLAASRQGEQWLIQAGDAP